MDIPCKYNKIYYVDAWCINIFLASPASSAPCEDHDVYYATSIESLIEIQFYRESRYACYCAAYLYRLRLNKAALDSPKLWNSNYLLAKTLFARTGNASPCHGKDLPSICSTNHKQVQHWMQHSVLSSQSSNAPEPYQLCPSSPQGPQPPSGPPTAQSCAEGKTPSTSPEPASHNSL